MNQIVDFIKKYQQQNPSGWRKWIIGSIVAILSLVVIGWFAFQAAQRGKELAHLQSEHDKAKEALHHAEVDAKLTANTEEAAHHEAAANAALAHAEQLKEQITQLENDHKANEAMINSIRTWDDVDKVVK